ncbi:hypothetical protein MMC34_003692 [Xylographa carneopallida]|nr:hypothetical protein [Xylographa carneopallida]
MTGKNNKKAVEEENPKLPDPTNPNDITTWNPDLPVYSKDNPHPILGCLDPPPSWFVEVNDVLMDDNGKPLLDRDNNLIIDWPEWPRYISSKIDGHDMEVLFRASNQVSYKDIWARQPCWVKKPSSLWANRMNQRRLREGRIPFKGICWSRRYATRISPKTLAFTIADLTHRQIRYNTNFPIKNNAIISPVGGQVLPLDHYLDQGALHEPSQMVYNTLVFIYDLACTTTNQMSLQGLQLLVGNLLGDSRTGGDEIPTLNATNFQAQAATKLPVSRRRRIISTQPQSNKKPRYEAECEQRIADDEETFDDGAEFGVLVKEESSEDTAAVPIDESYPPFLYAFEHHHNDEPIPRARKEKAMQAVDQWLYGNDDRLLENDEGSDEENYEDEEGSDEGSYPSLYGGDSEMEEGSDDGSHPSLYAGDSEIEEGPDTGSHPSLYAGDSEIEEGSDDGSHPSLYAGDSEVEEGSDDGSHPFLYAEDSEMEDEEDAKNVDQGHADELDHEYPRELVQDENNDNPESILRYSDSELDSAFGYDDENEEGGGQFEDYDESEFLATTGFPPAITAESRETSSNSLYEEDVAGSRSGSPDSDKENRSPFYPGIDVEDPAKHICQYLDLQYYNVSHHETPLGLSSEEQPAVE